MSESTSRTDNNRQRRIDLLAELVGINSVNPLQAGERSGPGGEGPLAQWLADRCSDLGAQVTLDEVEPGRPNVYALFEGTSERLVCIDVHMDTVGVEHMEGDPFQAKVEDGRVYGRGSVDTKATLAILLALFEEANEKQIQPEPSVLVVGSIGEEIGGLPGAYRFREWLDQSDLQVDELIIAEPTSCAAVHGHKGVLGLEVTVNGVAAHSSKPELGADAIVGAARVISALDQEHHRLISANAPTSMGTGTLTVTEIEGGRARNIVADYCQLFVGRRVAPGEDPNVLFSELSALIAEAAYPLTVSIEMTYGRASSAFYRAPNSALVERLSDLAETTPTVATYGSNALAYSDLAADMAVFGPGSIDQAHKAVEWVEIADLDRAARTYGVLLFSRLDQGDLRGVTNSQDIEMGG